MVVWCLAAWQLKPQQPETYERSKCHNNGKFIYSFIYFAAAHEQKIHRNTQKNIQIKTEKVRESKSKKTLVVWDKNCLINEEEEERGKKKKAKQGMDVNAITPLTTSHG